MFESHVERVQRVFQDDYRYGGASLFQDDYVQKPAPLFAGFHFSDDPRGALPGSCHLDVMSALEQANGGGWITRVRFSGNCTEAHGKVTGNDRSAVWCKNAHPSLREFITSCGESVPDDCEDLQQLALDAAKAERERRAEVAAHEIQDDGTSQDFTQIFMARDAKYRQVLAEIRAEQSERLKRLLSEGTAAGPPAPRPEYINTSNQPTQVLNWSQVP